MTSVSLLESLGGTRLTGCKVPKAAIRGTGYADPKHPALHRDRPGKLMALDDGVLQIMLDTDGDIVRLLLTEPAADADAVTEVVHPRKTRASLRYFGEIQFAPMPVSTNHPGPMPAGYRRRTGVMPNCVKPWSSIRPRVRQRPISISV
jgi:hypothetical protein